MRFFKKTKRGSVVRRRLQFDALEERVVLADRLLVYLAPGSFSSGTGLQRFRDYAMADPQLKDRLVVEVAPWPTNSLGLPVSPITFEERFPVLFEDFLRRHQVDPRDKVAVGGHSVGGHAALLTASSRAVDGLLLWDPIDPRLFSPNQSAVVKPVPAGMEKREVRVYAQRASWFANLGSFGYTVGDAFNNLDWVGVKLQGTSNTNYVAWQQTNGGTAGMASFTLPPGNYVAGYFKSWGYTNVAVSTPIVIPSPEMGYSLTVDQTQFSGAESVTVSWTTPAGSDNQSDWIGFYDEFASPTQYRNYFYTGGASQGSQTVQLPGPGRFKFLYLKRNGYTSVAESAPIVVTSVQGVYTLAASQTRLVGEGTVTVSHATPTGGNSAGDWYGLYNEEYVSDGHYVTWMRTNGQASGSVNLRLTEPGRYNIRLFQGNTWTKVATSPTIVVDPWEGVYRLDIVQEGNTIRVRYETPPESTSDVLTWGPDGVGGTSDDLNHFNIDNDPGIHVDALKFLRGLLGPQPAGMSVPGSGGTVPGGKWNSFQPHLLAFSLFPTTEIVEQVAEERGWSTPESQQVATSVLFAQPSLSRICPEREPSPLPQCQCSASDMLFSLEEPLLVL
jgi:hypothetical protein